MSKSGITVLTSDSEFKKLQEIWKDEINERIIGFLAYYGELFTVEAKLSKSYKDQSSLLTSSIGYVISENGDILLEKFEEDGKEGAQKSKQLAREVAAIYNKGHVLICVAGMEYAGYVEAKKNKQTGDNYRVISSAGEKIRELMRQAIKSDINNG